MRSTANNAGSTAYKLRLRIARAMSSDVAAKTAIGELITSEIRIALRTHVPRSPKLKAPLGPKRVETLRVPSIPRPGSKQGARKAGQTRRGRHLSGSNV